MARTGEDVGDYFAYLASIVQSSDDAIIGKTLDGIIVSWNAGAERLYGYTPDEAIGQSINMLVPADRDNEVPGILAEILAGRRVDHYETLRRRKDGTIVSVSVTVSPVRDETGRVVGASAVARDITDRRRAHEASAYLASIVESSDDAIIGKTLDGTIVSWNAGAERLYGYRPEEAIGQPISMLVSDSRDDEVPQILAEVAAGRSIEHYETIRRRKDGSRVDVSLTVSPIRDAEGRVVGASAVARDITDRRRAEEARRAQALELNDDVVQGLVAAQYAFELGRAEEAERSVRATLAAARRIVADLFGSQAPRPGDFQRSRPTELG